MKEYGKIRWIRCMMDAPVGAEVYLVRELNDFSVRFERYKHDSSFVLMDFPIGAFNEDSLEDTLIECRKIMNSSKNIWVVMPGWKYREMFPREFEEDLRRLNEEVLMSTFND